MVQSTNTGQAKLRWTDRYALRRAHPVRIIISMVAAIWIVYQLWQHRWLEAVVVVLISEFVGLVALPNIDYRAMAETTWGKMALLHLNPVNFILQVIGAVWLIYGIWMHSAEMILIAVSLIVFGHLAGWPRVYKTFSLNGKEY